MAIRQMVSCIFECVLMARANIYCFVLAKVYPIMDEALNLDDCLISLLFVVGSDVPSFTLFVLKQRILLIYVK